MGGPLTVFYVAASVVTAAAVPRVAARVFRGLGPRPETGSGERPETWHRLRRVPDTLTAGAVAVGVAPGFAEVVARSVHETGSAGVFTSVHWTPAGVLALLAVVRPQPLAAPDRALWLRRLRSGHVGDYVAWVLVGTTVLGALTLPGMLSG